MPFSTSEHKILYLNRNTARVVLLVTRKLIINQTILHKPYNAAPLFNILNIKYAGGKYEFLDTKHTRLYYKHRELNV